MATRKSKAECYMSFRTYPYRFGSNYIFNDDLYEILLQLLVLNFNDDDLCMLIIKDPDSKGLIGYMENLFTEQSSKIRDGDDFFDYEYMPFKQFLHLLIIEKEAFRKIMATYNVEIKIAKTPKDFKNYLDYASKSEHVVIETSRFNNLGLIIKDEKFSYNSSSGHFYDNRFHEFIPLPEHNISNWSFFLTNQPRQNSSTSQINHIELTHIHIGSSRHYDIQNIWRRTEEMFTKGLCDFSKAEL